LTAEFFFARAEKIFLRRFRFGAGVKNFRRHFGSARLEKIFVAVYNTNETNANLNLSPMSQKQNPPSGSLENLLGGCAIFQRI